MPSAIDEVTFGASVIGDETAGLRSAPTINRNGDGLLATNSVAQPSGLPNEFGGVAVRANAGDGSASLIAEHCVSVHYLSDGQVAVRFKRGTPLPAKRLVANLLRRRCVKEADLKQVCGG